MQLNFHSYGSGFPLIVLHGLLGSLDNWHTVAGKLGESHHVLTVDLRNHGRSPHAEEFDYSMMAEDIVDFIAQQNLARVNVLGHSMGGKVAMHLALRHPALVERLIVVDMAPKSYPPWHVPLLDALRSLDLTTFRERNEVSAALAVTIPDLATRQFVLKSLARDENGAFRWKMNLDAISRNYHRLTESVEFDSTFDGPVMFLKGGRSDYIMAGDMAPIHQLFPRTTVKTIAEAGHWIHADAPAAFVAIVNRFLLQ